MFEPGHLHITHAPMQPSDLDYDIHIRYETREDPIEGTCMHFTLQGLINGEAFEDEFQLPRDLAFNFAHDANRIAIKHGLPSLATLPLTLHKDYDLMFADIHAKLNLKPGEPIKPEHLT